MSLSTSLLVCGLFQMQTLGVNYCRAALRYVQQALKLELQDLLLRSGRGGETKTGLLNHQADQISSRNITSRWVLWRQGAKQLDASTTHGHIHRQSPERSQVEQQRLLNSLLISPLALSNSTSPCGPPPRLLRGTRTDTFENWFSATLSNVGITYTNCWWESVESRRWCHFEDGGGMVWVQRDSCLARTGAPRAAQPSGRASSITEPFPARFFAAHAYPELLKASVHFQRVHLLKERAAVDTSCCVRTAVWVFVDIRSSEQTVGLLYKYRVAAKFWLCKVLLFGFSSQDCSNLVFIQTNREGDEQLVSYLL